MGFDELTPRQLAPSVGKNSAGLEVSSVPPENGNSPIGSTNGNSPAASTNHNSTTQSTYGNSPIRSNIGSSPTSPTDLALNPHSPEVRETFADLESGLELTVGKFNFFVNKFGTQDLTDPRQLATAAPEAPSTASVPLSILEVCSPATTMSTGEINEYITQELQGEEAESGYHKNDLEFDFQSMKLSTTGSPSTISTNPKLITTATSILRSTSTTNWTPRSTAASLMTR